MGVGNNTNAKQKFDERVREADSDCVDKHVTWLRCQRFGDNFEVGEHLPQQREAGVVCTVHFAVFRDLQKGQRVLLLGHLDAKAVEVVREDV